MNAKETAKILLDIKAVTLSPNKPYTWASGIKSPIYCDNRLLMSYPDKRKQIIGSFNEIITENNLDFDIIAGTATAGIPHAAWLAELLNKPMIYIRGSAKGHGKGNQIEGLLEKGKKVLVIEDLVSTGGSSISAVDAVRDAGGKVIACLAIFTYGLNKAKQKFDEADCRLFTLSNFDSLIDVASESGYIEESDKEKVLEWKKDPQGWAEAVGVK